MISLGASGCLLRLAVLGARSFRQVRGENGPRTALASVKPVDRSKVNGLLDMSKQGVL
jgi:hypothetical protein